MDEDIIKIVVADDHEVFRRGLVELLKEEPRFRLVGEAEDGRAAVELSTQRRPDVVLLDIHMPGSDGIEALRRIKDQLEARVLILTVSERDRDLMEAIDAGADGYLLKNAKPRQLREAIKNIFAGHGALSPEITPQVIKTVSRYWSDEPKVKLSPREREVLELLARGDTTREIAATLTISKNTVKTHVHRILKKLEASNRTEAVARAASLGLLR